MAIATDYTPDPKNANKGTERGVYLLDQSIQETGLGRSIVVDKNGVVIAGNKTLQAAIDAGLVEVKEVETDGNQLVVVRRTDLDLSEDERARKLAYFDNRAGEVGLEWDSAQLLADLEAGFDLSGMFREDELDLLIAGLSNPSEEDWLSAFEGSEPGDLEHVTMFFTLGIEEARIVKQALSVFDGNNNDRLLTMARQCLNL